MKIIMSINMDGHRFDICYFFYKNISIRRDSLHTMDYWIENVENYVNRKFDYKVDREFDYEMDMYGDLYLKAIEKYYELRIFI